ncbi:hypothetical protein [Streptomyces sp. NBRC 110028]|uniref:hypothetical protein n=1 Tax=Streptomyces sp. NBRC 110028 TaxID=1621260 RepID=UPI0006E33A16|nr:hypothetical protein [Streptomyces sp. NBRC 110028]
MPTTIYWTARLPPKLQILRESVFAWFLASVDTPWCATSGSGSCKWRPAVRPPIEHLALWLGLKEYADDCEVAHLAPILAGTRLPAVKRLALHNSEIQDDFCAALAAAPVVARLDEISISTGVLTDDGATALLTGQPLTHLKIAGHAPQLPQRRVRI